MILGKIRYFGHIPNHRGVMFGIEIMDKEHRGTGTTDRSPHFQCLSLIHISEPTRPY